MATINPSLEIIKRQKVQPTEGEWALISFLIENLDVTYEIYYQPYLNGDNPDLAIMRKGSGVLIIEVKDWKLSNYYIDERTKWHLIKDNTPIKSPLNQVENYKTNLFGLHLEELQKRNTTNKNMWATVSCGVYFHNASQQEIERFLINDFSDSKYDSYRKFLKYFCVMGRNSLNKKILDEILFKTWMNRTSYYFDEALYSSLQRYLYPPIHQLEEGKKIIYSKEQKELIESFERRRSKIKGVAGSGKTLVLAKRAVNAHLRTGAKVLILTYNISLKNYIRDRISDVREEFSWNGFYITNYHQFFKTQANNYNIEIQSLNAWQDTNFFAPVESNLERYDVVLIDEIQDYQQHWIDIIARYFMHEGTELVVFGDEKQNIYERKLDENNEPVVRTIPGRWNRSLNSSFRFGGDIANLAIRFQKEVFKQKYQADELTIMSQIDFDKRIIEYHYFDQAEPMFCLQKIYQVLQENQIHSSDAGILGAKVELLRVLDYSIRTVKHERTMTTFESQEEFEKLEGNADRIEDLRRFKKNHFYMKTGTVKLSSVHSFKGWEIDTLFLFIEKDDSVNGKSNAELIYTGITRAKKNLIIFNIENRLYDQFFEKVIERKFRHVG